MNNIQPRYDGDIGGNDQFRGLFQDKELYGDQQEINKDKFRELFKKNSHSLYLK